MAPTVGILNDGITKIRLMPNQIAAGWGYASPQNDRETVEIIASKSKDMNMYFDKEKGDSRIIGGFSIKSTNRIQVNVTYEGQTFYLFCQPVSL